MTYLGYVVAAYAIFVVVLLWDLIAPLLRIRRILRNVSLRAKRASAQQDAPISTELQR
ncbi:MAG: heme exporter protein CcmD [Lysobacteraceae bacterium]